VFECVGFAALHEPSNPPRGAVAYFGYMRGKSWRRPVEIIVSLLHVAGVWFFYVPEAFAGFPHLGGWPSKETALSFDRLVFFWFGFWFCGILWTVVPLAIIRTSVLELSAFVAEHDARAPVLDALNGSNGHGKRRNGKHA
jgi:hypothetical protein